MKTRIFAFALICFFFNILQPVSAAVQAHVPEVKVVVSAKRIWLVTDEIAVKNMTVKVLDHAGKVVMEKNFSSKMTDWSLQIEQLPKGSYSVQIDGRDVTAFKH